jgi:GTP-binding protein
VAIDVPEDYLGVVTQLMALRKGLLIEMVNHNTGWVRMDYRIPARGLVGFRTEFMTETRGTGVLHHVFDGWEPWVGELKTRRNGVMVADRQGVVTSHALESLQERGQMFVGPTTEVYEGMIVGENPRNEDISCNAVRAKALTNFRSQGSGVATGLTPATKLSLERAIEYIAADEFVEVTPKNLRLRKRVLNATLRRKEERKG